MKGKRTFIRPGKRVSSSSPHNQILLGGELIVDNRYQVNNMIGAGAYGVVWSAYDRLNNEEVAIKKIQTAFNRAIDAKRILREIKILSKSPNSTSLINTLSNVLSEFFDHENIIKLIDIVKPPHITDYQDVYIVTEKMEADLNRLIHSQQVLTD